MTWAEQNQMDTYYFLLMYSYHLQQLFVGHVDPCRALESFLVMEGIPSSPKFKSGEPWPVSTWNARRKDASKSFLCQLLSFRRKPPQTHVQHPANPGTAPFGPPNTQADTLRQGISKEIARSDRGEGVGSMFDPKFPVGIITLAG